MASELTISPSQTKKRPLAACACILAAGSLWGMIGMWNRYLMAGGLSPTSIVLVRNLGGAILLSGVLALRDRSVFRVEKAHLKYFFGTGVISIVLFTACYFSCQQVCSLALASILLYTAPAIVMLLSALLWKEPVTRRKLLALALTLTGYALVCGVFGGRPDRHSRRDSPGPGGGVLLRPLQHFRAVCPGPLRAHDRHGVDVSLRRDGLPGAAAARGAGLHLRQLLHAGADGGVDFDLHGAALPVL